MGLIDIKRIFFTRGKEFCCVNDRVFGVNDTPRRMGLMLKLNIEKFVERGYSLSPLAFTQGESSPFAC